MNKIAEEICFNQGYVTADNLRTFCKLRGMTYKPFTFRYGWKRIGDEVSKVVGNRGRRIGRWTRVYLGVDHD